MPKRPDFKPVETTRGWMVSIPPSMSADGRRERKFHAKESDAERFAKTLRSQYAQGLRGSVVDPGLGRQAAEAYRLLEPHGISLLDAAKLAVSHHLAAKNSETF